jgi:CheY-like chemotaxis protein
MYFPGVLPQGRGTRAMKILLIDDDSFALQMLCAQLRTLPLAERGYGDVVLHQCARDAMADVLHGHTEVGLIICDLQMPDMDGVEVVRQLVCIGYTGGLVLVSGENPRVLQAAERLARAHHLYILGRSISRSRHANWTSAYRSIAR